MNRKEVFAAAAAAMILCAGCGAHTGDESVPQTTSVSASPVDAKTDALSGEKHGYGQGTQLDENKVPIGAKQFNEQYKQLGARALYEDSDKITLTFDQGYENGFTSKILDILKEKKVHAVFFLVKDYAERNPQLVKRMIEEGHTIANHSVNHYSMPQLTEEQCRQEIMDMHDYIKENYGVTMTLFRPPMGEFSEKSLAVTKSCGYETVMWSFAYADWDTQNQPDQAQALKKLTDAAHKGAIYLLHSVSATNAAVLADMIDNIRKDGYDFN